ncbi:bifunctional diguanylate cyclase/phosphodiesterase [Thiomicrorhabdus sp. zzn3]|uniref:putative bifunctional diguanylate cyclase/phosphodiesterase n=1 Tax=Thiomicrorhabdus sp. zzn3 TaxID=3039775 RepID=UPI0024364F59|nr:bifunctional diguanylate cyclase/phosphodiesterase [Thiomicrorhabdus sp. zzn3]MDG6778475.1 bifunctional diguanylate cyclase/phosphodiesterase [Thiomicrorhabdus sp. zzn3]
MKLQSTFSRPLRFYFALFLSAGFILLAVLIGSLYLESHSLQKNVLEQAHKEAQQELFSAVENTLKVTDDQLSALTEWDEVHQQFHDPSYYFYWHDDRLQESGFYYPYYEALELYTPHGQLLAPASPGQQYTKHLPTSFTEPQAKIVGQEDGSAYLLQFHPIYNRDSGTLLGYVGVSINFFQALYQLNQFYYLDTLTPRVKTATPFEVSQLPENITFAAVSNPVNSYLWTLMEKFIGELVVTLLLAALLLLFFFNKVIRSPLLVLSDYLHQLKASPDTEQKPPKAHFWIQEFEEFKQTLYEFHHNLRQAQQKLDKQNELVWEQARRDALTNIFNRRAFDEAWGEVVADFQAQPIPTAFMLFDCDFFKALNDTYGHEIGDEVIRISAKIIQSSLPLECPAYRIGGDEFAVIVQHRDQEEIEKIAQKCLDELKAYPFNSIGIVEKLSFSVGISSLAKYRNDVLTNLPRQADLAMYKAKQSHQTKIQFYSEMLEEEASALVSNRVTNRVVEAIHTGEHIEMHFQPIISVDQSSCYYETLVRIRGEEGLIYPNELFTVVERRRLEVELDQRVIEHTLKFMEQNQLPDQCGLSINLSGKTLLQPNVIELFKPFKKWLKEHKLVIEVTENFLITHIDHAKQVLNELRELGFEIALDDFGSGYSSIRYLAHMPVDIIKFDRSMTLALTSDTRTQQIIQATADMIRQSGYDLVMEGIEDQVMLEAANQAGATHVQGYLIGRPENHFSTECHSGCCDNSGCCAS